MDHQELVRLSKRMSLALRHRPDRFGLALDEAGWVPVDDLLAALRIGRADLDAVVAGNDKQRFAVERGPDGVERVRANQGHSVPVDLGLAPAEPPALLYHGTGAAALDSILAAGLHRAAGTTYICRRTWTRRGGWGRGGPVPPSCSPWTPRAWPARGTSSTAAPTASG